MSIVADASVILSWYFEDEDNPPASLLERLASERIVVPGHWETELANGVVAAERRGRVPVSQISRLFGLLEALRLSVDDEGNFNALRRIAPLARAHGLTVYDAIYLELAERRGFALATHDKALARAARAIGLEVLAG